MSAPDVHRLFARHLLTRRRFLKALAASSGIAVVGCSPDDDAGPTTSGPANPSTTSAGTTATTAPTSAIPTTAPLDPAAAWWRALEDLSAATKSSPDHFASRYDEVVAAGDVDGLVSLVRKFQPMLGLRSFSDGTRMWGTRGVVRSGWGSMRDIVDVLHQGLIEMGQTAQVVTTRQFDLDALYAFRAEPADFDPGDLDDIYARLGFDTDQQLDQPVVLDVDDVHALADEVFDRVIDELNPDKLTFSAIPAVAVPDGDQFRVLDIWSVVADDALVGRYRDAGEGDPTQELTVTLYASFGGEPDEHVTLVSGTWRWEELVGRRIQTSMVPAANELDQLLAARPSALTTWVPMIRLTGLDLPVAAEGEQPTTELGAPTVVAGNAITLSGTVVEIDESDAPGAAEPANGDVFDPEAVVRRTAEGAGDPAAVAQIELISANTDRAPLVELLLRPLDVSGNSVSGLPGSAFALRESGTLLPASLDQTEPLPARFTFVGDQSRSVAEEWREAMPDLIRRTVTAVNSTGSPALTRGMTVTSRNFNLVFDTDIETTIDDSTALQSGSPVWAAASLAGQGSTAVIMLSDFDASDGVDSEPLQIPPEFERRIANGPPIIAIVVPGDDTRTDVARLLADLSGGEAIEVADIDAAIARVEALAVVPPPPVRLTVGLPLQGPPVRELELRVGAAAPVIIEVEMPEAAPSNAPGLVGLHLQIETNRAESWRTLAGWHDGRDDPTPTPADRQEVQMAMLSTFELLIEAESPTGSALIADLYDDQLRRRPMFEATDVLGALTASADVIGLRGNDWDVSLPLVIRDGEPITHGTTPRLSLVSRRRRVAEDGEEMVTAIDLIGCNSWATPGVADPIEQARWTARRTMRLSAIEARLYEQSTLAALEGVALQVASPFEAPDGTNRAAWRRFTDGHDLVVFDPLRPTEAAWGVSRTTGQVIGLLSDGSGGAQDVARIERIFDAIIRALEAVEELAGGSILGAFASLERAKTIVLKKATIAIATMEAPDDIGLPGLGCEAAARSGGRVADDVAGRLGGPVGQALSEAISRYNAGAASAGFDQIPTPGSFIGGACGE